jgi:hypothetical protein
MICKRAAFHAISFVGALALASCGGQSFDPGQTVVTGIVTPPRPEKCLDLSRDGTGCSASGAPVAVFQPPNAPFAMGPLTSASDVYSTGDITKQLGLIGGGSQTIIAVAVIANPNGSPEAQTVIGGLVPLLKTGAVTTKDFNPTTHIACQAGVYLTGAEEPVPAPCPDAIPDPPLSANAIDELATNILEQASAEIADEVVFPTEVPCSACAVIRCTNAGSSLAEPGCVAAEFARNRGQCAPAG